MYPSVDLALSHMGLWDKMDPNLNIF
jgi:hypothetical protein